MKKIMAALFILIGISVMLYPAINNFYTSYQQEKMISEWEKNKTIKIPFERSNEKTAIESFVNLDEVFSKAEEGLQPLQTAKASAEVSKPTKKVTGHPSELMMGTIEIKRIDLKLPILEGASQKNLKVGAGHLSGTALPGEMGNSAIAAHRSRTFGKMFNRLGEIRVGDKIVVKDRGETYVYKVYDKVIVKPSNTKVLNQVGSEKTLTLITCDPVDTATHRLIIKARLSL